MRIIQLMPTLSFGDAVGNDAIALQNTIVGMGYRTKIYAENVPDRYLREGIAKKVEDMPVLTSEDVLIYHLSTGTNLNNILPSLTCQKICIYHNITPPSFFAGYDRRSFRLTQQAYIQVEKLKDVFDCCIADSEYNKQDLLDMGYRCPIYVLPILIPFEDYKKMPDAKVKRWYADGRTNLLFVGRVAPNKCHQDVISAFAVYKKQYDADARLFLVGSYRNEESYYLSLCDYYRRLGLTDSDVVFLGHISFEEILAYYTMADVFVCMSEHEGFCVPLVEAMCFQVPIVAYHSSAVPETLKGAGLLLEDKHPAYVAAAIHRLLNDEALRIDLQKKAERRLSEFSYSVISQCFEKLLTDFIPIHEE